MKLTKKALALVLALLMVTSVASFVTSAATFKFTAKSGSRYEVSSKVYFTEYDITSGVNGNKTVAQTLEFNPADGYMPIAFGGNAGWAQTLEKQYNAATGDRWGYEVVGIINGSYFSTANGMLIGYTVADGRVTSAHNGHTDNMIVFDKDGKMTTVENSSLDFKLYTNGKELSNALWYINKVPDAGKVEGRVYYYDSACGTISDSAEIDHPGYEVICNKVENSELSIGGTLVGEVAEVKTTRGNTIGKNQFVLYCKSDATYASTLGALKKGDQIKISVSETNSAIRETMENCVSAIPNIGYLVKDGVNLTLTKTEIGSHNVTTTKARWTAIGTKPDGSYVFMTIDGGDTGKDPGTTLRDCAAAMIQLGCTNVIRFDGGGSTAMYLSNTGSGSPGYKQNHGRGVPDCLMIVKTSSLAPSAELKTALNDALKAAEKVYAENETAVLKAAIDKANAVKADTDATEGMYKSAIMALTVASSGKKDLENLVADVAGITFSDYSEVVLAKLREAYNNATAVLADNNASTEKVLTAYEELLYWYSLKGDQEINVAQGSDYTISTAPNASYPDTDGVELTDGKPGDGSNGKSASWVGLNGKSSYDVVVDLGSVVDGLESFEVDALHIYTWGIQLPKSVTVSVSDDNKNWQTVGTGKPQDGIVGVADTGDKLKGSYTIEIKANKPASGRYVKYTLNSAASFIFIGELTANVSAKKSDGLFLTGFNLSILTNNTAIINGGKVTQAAYNPRYCTNLWLKWDNEANGYVITKKVTSNGSFADYTLASDEIMILVHYDNTATNDPMLKAAEHNLTLAKAAEVGQVLRTSGIDIKNAKTDVGAYFWFEDVTPDVTLGDVTGDGKIDNYDYILVRAQILGLNTLSDKQMAAADVNKDGKVDTFDYILIRAHILGLKKI